MNSRREKTVPRTETILVVDDEPEVCKLAERILRQDQFQVLSAISGPAALAELQQHAVALVILDICLPGMDGIQVLKKIRETHKDLPVVMLTGHADLDSAREAMRLGAYDYITKPFNIDLMKKIVREAAARGTAARGRGDVCSVACVE